MVYGLVIYTAPGVRWVLKSWLQGPAAIQTGHSTPKQPQDPSYCPLSSATGLGEVKHVVGICTKPEACNAGWPHLLPSTYFCVNIMLLGHITP